MIDEYRIAAAPRPRLDVDGAQVADVERRNDVEALGLDPAGIGRFLLGREFFRQLFRGEGGLGHAKLLPKYSTIQKFDVAPGTSSPGSHSWAPSRSGWRRICPTSCARRSDPPSAS